MQNDNKISKFPALIFSASFSENPADKRGEYPKNLLYVDIF